MTFPKKAAVWPSGHSQYRHHCARRPWKDHADERSHAAVAWALNEWNWEGVRHSPTQANSFWIQKRFSKLKKKSHLKDFQSKPKISSRCGSSKVKSMDSDQLEQERGITILAKNAAVTYKGIKAKRMWKPGNSEWVRWVRCFFDVFLQLNTKYSEDNKKMRPLNFRNIAGKMVCRLRICCQVLLTILFQNCRTWTFSWFS